MEAVEVIETYIESNDKESFLSFIYEYVSSNKNKKELVDLLIYIFSKNYIDNNLWVIHKLHESFINIENATIKNMEDIASNFMTIFSILSVMKRRNYQFESVTDINNGTEKSLLYSFDKEYDNLLFTKDILNETPYSLLNIFQSKIIDANFRDALFIVKVLMNMKRKELLKGNDENLDVVDIIILCIKSMSIYLKKDIISFIDLCKDIHYYNANKKKKIDRINILYICIYIICKGSVKHQELADVSKRERIPSKYDALFIIFNYDHNLIAEVESIKSQKKYLIEKKVINIDNCNSNLINDGVPKNNINIIKT